MRNAIINRVARVAVVVAIFSACGSALSTELSEVEKELASGHPRASYDEVPDIDTMAAALRKQLASQRAQSFSRGWWRWDRLRARFVDGGRKKTNEIKILAAVFRALIFDWHRKLQARGDGDIFYIFFTTTARGNKSLRHLPNGRPLVRDLHGGGYHGGWGGASRMRIYDELVRQDLLTSAEKARFHEIVRQSMSRTFLDFERGSQGPDNHSFGNAGGVALALKLLPDAPNAKAARAWLDRIWGRLADFRDWTEWTYYPYGPIFLHGLVDIAEATGRIESDRELIRGIGSRALGFVHGGGVRGNPNSGAPVRKDLAACYADPWNVGYYNVETSGRDGHFWYRMAQHYKDPEYLWAAEQANLGGQAPTGKVPPEYEAAYKRRFGWFIERGIEPRVPKSRAAVGLLSAQKHRIPERIYLGSGREAGKPFAAFFLYEKKDQHLDNVSGHLYEYSAFGAKYLHTSGKYNNVYSGNEIRGGGTGEESLDLLLVMHQRHPFPVHPDRKGDARDFLRRGSIRHRHDFAKAENNDSGDSFGQLSFDHYYGKRSRWTRRVVLTSEGFLVVGDEYTGGEALGADYQAGPVWHLGVDDGTTDGPQKKSWFDAPALDQAWWQTRKQRVVLWIHPQHGTRFGSLKQRNSQDAHPNVTSFGYRRITNGKPERFLSVLIPHDASTRAEDVVARVKTEITESGSFVAAIDTTRVTVAVDGTWSVSRPKGSKRQ